MRHRALSVGCCPTQGILTFAVDVSDERVLQAKALGATDAVNGVEDSWGHLATVHTQIERYSKKSSLASLDPEFVGALVDRVPGGSERLAQVLENSRTVNNALQEALTYQFLKTRTVERTRSLTVDLLELLERVK